MVEAEYKAALDRLIRRAHENRNMITEALYDEHFGAIGLNEREDGLTRGYLDSIGISFEESGRTFEKPEFSEEDGKYLNLYLEELEALPSYTEEEIREAKLKAISDDDEEAQAVLMNHYLKDVVDIARLYIYQALPAEDLIGEGNIGLMTAIRSLSALDSLEEVDAFVGGLIMDAMDKAIYDDTDVRKQIDDMVVRINEVNERAKQLSEELKRPVTIAELAEDSGMKAEDIARAMRLSGDQIEGLIP